MKKTIIILAALSIAALGAFQAIAFTNVPAFKPFVGLDYSPFVGNQSPNQGTYPSIAQITFDLTNAVTFLAGEISTYSMDGTQSNIPAICNTYNIKCYPCAFLSPYYGSDASNELAALIAIGNSNYPTTLGLVVGTEASYEGYDLPTLISNINYVRAATHTNVPVGTRETLPTVQYHPEVVAACDFIMADIYAYWARIPEDQAATWTVQQWQALTNMYPGKRVMIGEVNWPSGGTNRFWSDPGVVTSVQNQGRFLSEFVSLAQSNNIEYFIFEYRDELWKIQQNNGTVEVNWGITDTNSFKKQSLVDFLSAGFFTEMVSAATDSAQIAVATYEGNPYSVFGTTNLEGGWGSPIANFFGAPRTNQTLVNVTNSTDTKAWFFKAAQKF